MRLINVCTIFLLLMTILTHWYTTSIWQSNMNLYQICKKNISDFFRREEVRLHNLEKRQMMKKKREQLQVYTRTKQYSQLVCILEVTAIGKIVTDKCKNN